MIGVLATCVIGSGTGCIERESFPDADVVAGPEGQDIFEPDALTVSVGDTVTWGFASSGHNISCRPAHDDAVELPDDADPFASFGTDEPPLDSHVSKGETFEHRFEVAGSYVYVCVPHATRGMVGTVTVE